MLALISISAGIRKINIWVIEIFDYVFKYHCRSAYHNSNYREWDDIMCHFEKMFYFFMSILLMEVVLMEKILCISGHNIQSELQKQCLIKLTKSSNEFIILNIRGEK